jgi:predicted DNA-binding transcriptional regulator YafY
MSNQTIIDAISHRNVLTFDYDGQPRTVNPHALYREDRTRNFVLHAWQTDGESNTRNPPCRGNFRVDQMVDLTALDENFFGAQPDFNPDRFRHLIHAL